GGAFAPTAAAGGAPIQYTAKTVMIPRALARKTLARVSKDHSTFEFRRAVGSLKRLRAGKVMLLEGTDAAQVTKVRHRKGRLIVSTRPAQLTDVVRSGEIQVEGQPDARKAFLAPTGPPAGAARAL